MISYLLGALSETEGERLDELSLTDDEFAGRLGAVENDLVDAYVRGELAGDALQRFDTCYLASPMRREKVALARTFLRFAGTKAAAEIKARQAAAPLLSETKKKPSPAAPRLSAFTPRRRALQWGMAAAALLMLVACAYLWVENVRLRNQMTESRAERAALQQREQELQRQLDDRRATAAETADELARVRERLAQLKGQPPTPSNENSGPAGRDLRVASFTLAPSLRGAAQPPQLTLPAATDLVALRLQLEANDFPAYQALLKNTATGQLVWRGGRLKADDKSQAVTVRLRAGLLRPQTYTLELSGVRPGGAAEIIGSYTFKIATP